MEEAKKLSEEAKNESIHSHEKGLSKKKGETYTTPSSPFISQIDCTEEEIKLCELLCDAMKSNTNEKINKTKIHVCFVFLIFLFFLSYLLFVCICVFFSVWSHVFR